MSSWQHRLAALPRWFQLGLGGLLAWQLGGWAAQLLQPVSPPMLPPLNFEQPEFQRHMLTATLFGASQASKAATQVQQAPARKMTPEQLGIEVAGVISLAGGQGVAVLKQKNGHTQVVRVGEQLNAQMRLESVSPQSITVSVNGERVLVPLQKDELEKAQSVLPTLPAPVDDVSEQALGTLAAQLRRQPFKALEYVQLVPVPQGVKVKSRPGKEKWLRALGLEAGDIITQIDGLPVKTLMRQPPKWQKLMRQQRWQVEVIRQGSTQSIEVNIP